MLRLSHQRVSQRRKLPRRKHFDMIADPFAYYMPMLQALPSDPNEVPVSLPVDHSHPVAALLPNSFSSASPTTVTHDNDPEMNELETPSLEWSDHGFSLESGLTPGACTMCKTVDPLVRPVRPVWEDIPRPIWNASMEGGSRLSRETTVVEPCFAMAEQSNTADRETHDAEPTPVKMQDLKGIPIEPHSLIPVGVHWEIEVEERWIWKWTTERVLMFLRQIGLDMYQDSFRKENIDGEVLMDFDDKACDELGIKSMHRKKLLRRIRASGLCAL